MTDISRTTELETALRLARGAIEDCHHYRSHIHFEELAEIDRVLDWSRSSVRADADYRDMIIEMCAVRAQQAPLPAYGTNARHTGREEARKKIVETIRALKSAAPVPALSRPTREAPHE